MTIDEAVAAAKLRAQATKRTYVVYRNTDGHSCMPKSAWLQVAHLGIGTKVKVVTEHYVREVE